MHTIIGQSFCTNYCITVALRRSAFSTAEVLWKPRSFWQWPSACCIVGSGAAHLPLDHTPIDFVWGSGQASWLVNRAQKYYDQQTSYYCCWKSKSVCPYSVEIFLFQHDLAAAHSAETSFSS